MSVEEKLQELGLSLPPAPSAVAIYRPAMTVGNLVYTSGHLPVQTDGELMLGCVGADVDLQFGYHAARQAGLAMLATLQQHLGDLDRIKRVVKLFGMVNCPSEFTEQPSVINGCSELMRSVFGEQAGIGTRSAVGVSSLPLGVAVEIEGIFEVE